MKFKKRFLALAAVTACSAPAFAGTLMCSGAVQDSEGGGLVNFEGGSTISGQIAPKRYIGFIPNADSSTKCPPFYQEVGFAATQSELNALLEAASGGAGNPNAVLYNNGGTPSAPGTVTVADGVNGKDAVNVDQLNNASSNTLNSANSYTDARTSEAINIANQYTDSKIGDTYNYVDNKFEESKNYTDEKTKYFKANSTGADSVVTGTDSIAIGPGAVVAGNRAIAGGMNVVASGDDSVVFGANSKGLAKGAVALGSGAVASNAGDVALGEGSTTAATVATTGTTINGNEYTFAGSAPTSTVSVGGEGAERTVTNVAAGRLNATSTDAVNGSQLASTNRALDTLGDNVNTLGSNTAANFGAGSSYNPATGAISAPAYKINKVTYSDVGSAFDALGNTIAGNNTSNLPAANATGKDSVAIGGGSVADRDNTVSFGTPGAERQLANVAPGTAGTDATNLNQVRNMVGSSVQEARAYTDQAVNALDQKTQKQMAGVGAMAMAASALVPNARAEGNTSISLGAGAYGGESAIAAGVNYYVSNQVLLNAKVSVTSSGPAKAGAAVGATFSF